MIPKDDLVRFARKEFATTLRVLNAFPPEMKEFRPHERSSNAIQLTSTFVFEFYLIRMNLLGDQIDPSIFKTYKPDSFQTVVQDFANESQRVIEGLEKLTDADLAKIIKFAGVGFNADEFVLMMICDQIHHRGQLSVYVRMAGGKVPSIYGPSADDTSRNF